MAARAPELSQPLASTANGASSGSGSACTSSGSGSGSGSTSDGAAAKREINLIFLIIAFAAVDATVAIPSLWPYIHSLGGDQFLYGFAGAATNGIQIFSLPLFGWLSDKLSRKSILLAGHLIMVVGGAMYGLAGSLGPGNAALTCIIVARMLIGLAAGARSSAQSYITTKSAPEDRTANLGVAQAVTRAGLFCGPGFNFVVVSLPEGQIGPIIFT